MNHLFHRTGRLPYYAWSLCGREVKTIRLVDRDPDCPDCQSVQDYRDRQEDEQIVLAGKEMFASL